MEDFIIGMDWDDLCELADDLDAIIDSRDLEKKHDLEGMDICELKALRKAVSNQLDKMEDEETNALEAEYWRSVL